MSVSTADRNSLLPDDDGSFGASFTRISPDRRTEAVTRLLAGNGRSGNLHAQRFLAFAAENNVSLDQLWGAMDSHQRLQAVVLAVPGAGRTAMCFVSPSRDRRNRQLASRLLHAAIPQVAALGCRLFQALVDPLDQELAHTYIEGGFHQLARLNYLERPIRGRSAPPEPDWPIGVSLHRGDEDIAQTDLIEILDETYEDTLDCPGLRGIRSTADILDGHRAAGNYDPHLWTLLKVNDKPAGVLFMNPAADRTSIELVYIGLAKFARGAGLGSRLLRHGLRQISNRTERIITLAVDEINQPALRMYAREHFRPVLRRIAFIRSFS